MTSRPSTAARFVTIALAVFALIVVPLGTYVAGYLLLPVTHYWINDGTASTVRFGRGFLTIERVYPQQWMTTAFLPAAKFEGWLRGIEVQPTWSEEPFPHNERT